MKLSRAVKLKIIAGAMTLGLSTDAGVMLHNGWGLLVQLLGSILAIWILWPRRPKLERTKAVDNGGR